MLFLINWPIDSPEVAKEKKRQRIQAPSSPTLRGQNHYWDDEDILDHGASSAGEGGGTSGQDDFLVLQSQLRTEMRTEGRGLGIVFHSLTAYKMFMLSYSELFG